MTPARTAPTDRTRARAIVEAGLGLLLAAVALFACALLTQTLTAPD